MGSRKLKLLIGALLVLSLIVVGYSVGTTAVTAWTQPAGSAVVRVVNTLQAATTPQTATSVAAQSGKNVTINIAQGADVETQILEAVYQKVNPSVVKVYNLAHSRNLPSGQAVPQSEGSGFVWDLQGHIVTNDHVVSGADQLQVVFSDGTTIDAKLIGTDPNGDIAVIQVDPTLVNLVPVEVGDMSQVQVGERAIAIGNPFGFAGTMTSGIVSALGRSIPSVTGFSIPEAIQTDTAINPGNSGGPLLNDNGQVIGVNDQIQSSSGSNSGVGFALPISIVQRIVPALIKTGQYQHSYLGIEGGTYTMAWSDALGLPTTAKGAYVMGVVGNSPAGRGGLRAGNQDTNVLLGVSGFGQASYLQKGGDLITAINGQPVTKMDDLLIYLEEHTSPGDQVQLSVFRSGQSRTVTVTLGQRPAQASPLG